MLRLGAQTVSSSAKAAVRTHLNHFSYITKADINVEITGLRGFFVQVRLIDGLYDRGVRNFPACKFTSQQVYELLRYV